MSTRIQKVAATPLATMFQMHQKGTRVVVWLSEQADLRLEGKIAGFDEYMNIVLDDAEEVSIKKKVRKSLGMVLLKGENVSLMHAAK